MVDKNTYASQWANGHYNLTYIPSCYYDGGQYNRIGGYNGDTAVFAYPLRLSGAREVPDIDLQVEMTWLSNSQMEVTVTVTNNNFVNFAPDGPDAPTGPTAGLKDEAETFSFMAVDPEGDDVYFKIDWGGEVVDWMGPFKSGEVIEIDHTWLTPGVYSVSMQAKDVWDYESPWSNNSTPIKIVQRGDSNGDYDINVADAVKLINYVFLFGPAPEPILAGDANCDLETNVADAVSLINHVFNGGPAPGCY